MKTFSPAFRAEMDKRIRNKGVCSIAIPSPTQEKILYYTGTTILSVTTVDEVDPMSRSLPTETLTFRVFDYDGKLNPDNPNSYFAWFDVRREVYVTFGIKDDSGSEHTLDPEEYFITEQPSWQNYIATFKVVKLLGLLDKTTFYGSNSRNLYALAQADMEDAGLEINTEYGDGVIEPSLKNMTIWEWNQPEVTSHADTLLQIAAAGKCSIRSAPYSPELGRRVYLKNEYLSHDTLAQNGFLGVYYKDMYSHPSSENTPLIRQEIAVLTGAYYDFTETDEPEILATYTDTFQTTDIQTVVLEHGPAMSKTVVATNANIRNNVNASYANCTVVEFQPIDVQKTVTITVKGYAFGTFTHNYKYLIEASGEEDETFENPMVTPQTARDVALYRGEYLRNRSTYTVDYRGDPSIEVLDIIYVQLPYLGARKCLVLRTELTYNGAYHGKLIVKRLDSLQNNNPAISGIAISGVAICGNV